jgi:hypothetical protein
LKRAGEVGKYSAEKGVWTPISFERNMKKDFTFCGKYSIIKVQMKEYSGKRCYFLTDYRKVVKCEE